MARSNAFARFMALPGGRLLRIAAGLALIGWGWTMRGTTAGSMVMVLGIIPILAGVLNLCFIAPIIGAPFSGRAALEDDRTTKQ